MKTFGKNKRSTGKKRRGDYTARHRIRRKERYTESEKGKSPEAKGRWERLRKAG